MEEYRHIQIIVSVSIEVMSEMLVSRSQMN